MDFDCTVQQFTTKSIGLIPDTVLSTGKWQNPKGLKHAADGILETH